MSISAIAAAPGRTLSSRATTLYAVITAISFSATSSAVTPLYRYYQATLGLTALWVTVVFAVYAFAMLVAFVTISSLSDYVGRRPMILVALLANAAAMLVFAVSDSVAMLIFARILQGIGVGVAMPTIGATVLDAGSPRGHVYNSITAITGLSVGALLTGMLISFAPYPGQLVYLLLFAILAVEALLLVIAVPETGSRRQGAWRAVVPRVSVPRAVRPLMLRLAPLNIASWALGGFYLSLMPSLIAVATHITFPLLGAAIVSVLMLFGAASVLTLRNLAPETVLRVAMIALALGVAVTLAGIGLQSAPIMVFGTAIAGSGFGASFSANLRLLLPLAAANERAALFSAFFVESYLAFSLLSLAAGLAEPVLGLPATAYAYGATLIALIAIAAVATQRRHPAAVTGSGDAEAADHGEGAASQQQ